MYDIIVSGGGSAGYAVALAAARHQKKVLVIEQFGALGGCLTNSLVGYMMDVANKPGLVAELSKFSTNTNGDKNNFTFDIERLKDYMEQSLLCEHVEIMYYTKVVGVRVQGGNIKSLSVSRKDGQQELFAKVYVDCTGDGDVAYLAGCSFATGSEDGFCQPISCFSLIGGIALSDVYEFTANSFVDGGKIDGARKKLLNEMKKGGFEASYKLPTLHHIKNNIFLLAVDHQFLNGQNPDDLTKAMITGRHEMLQCIDALQSLGGVWKDMMLLQSPTYPGVRESRRIKGLYTVTKEDLVSGRKHADRMCTVAFNVDIHDQNGFTSGGVCAKEYDIPLRAMKSAEIENLYMAGRCISGDFYAHASYRVTGNTFAMGESLGNYLALGDLEK